MSVNQLRGGASTIYGNSNPDNLARESEGYKSSQRRHAVTANRHQQVKFAGARQHGKPESFCPGSFATISSAPEE
eukprot:4245469-Pyramimonas_sp.AAC.1